MGTRATPGLLKRLQPDLAIVWPPVPSVAR